MIARPRRSSDPAGPFAPDVAGLVLGSLVSPAVPGRPAAWWAVDEQGRDVVVQRVRPASGTGVPLAALDEASRRRALPHPHLLPLLRVVRCREGAVQVLGPATGGCLADLLAEVADLPTGAGHLPVGQVVTLVAGVGSALAALHEEGMVHGEVSATGVVLDERGMPLLLGWGAARPAPAGRVETRRRELRSTGPKAPRPADDVLALTRLALTALGPAHDDEARGLRSVLTAAEAADPAARPSAAALAAACWEVARAAPVDVPPSRRRHGAGADGTQVLRAGRRGTPALAPAADPRARWGTRRARLARRPARWAVLPLVAAAVIGVALAVLSGRGPTPAVALAVSPAVDPVAAAPSSVAPGTSPSSSAPAPREDPLLTGDDPAAAVEPLSVLRVRAITAGDAALLAAVDLPASPAAQRDDALVAAMSGQHVEGLEVTVLSARALERGADGTWVEVVSAASAHRVVTDDAVREVPAGEPVTSRLLLRRDAGAWKVADVA